MYLLGLDKSQSVCTKFGRDQCTDAIGYTPRVSLCTMAMGGVTLSFMTSGTPMTTMLYTIISCALTPSWRQLYFCTLGFLGYSYVNFSRKKFKNIQKIFPNVLQSFISIGIDQFPSMALYMVQGESVTAAAIC